MTGDAVHPCPIPGCPKRIAHKLLLCGPHWALVPHAHKTAVRRAYRPSIGGGGRAVPTAAYMRAVHEAVAAVCAVLAKRGEPAPEGDASCE